jgi:hypothetical protein
MMFMVIDAASVTGPQNNTKNVNYVITNRINPRKLAASPTYVNQHLHKLWEVFARHFNCGSVRENTKNVNDMISGRISPARMKTTKSTLMKNDGTYFHAMLGIDNKKNVLPRELGNDLYMYCLFRCS